MERLLEGILDGEAAWALGELEAGGWIEARGEGTVGPADPLRELMEKPMKLHGNIGSPGGQTVPLVDGVTGDPIAWVARGGTDRKIVLAGSAFRTVDAGDRIELYSDGAGTGGRPPRYASRGAPVGRAALLHLARGLGLPANALVPLDGMYVHFGGALLGRLLLLAGFESGPLRSVGDPRWLRPGDLTRLASKLWEELEPLCGFGPFHSKLPDSLRRKAVIATVFAHQPEEWVAGMVEKGDLSPRQAEILRQA